MVLNGATTIWERWDSDKMDPSMNSRNHYAFGAVGRWMMEDLAGMVSQARKRRGPKSQTYTIQLGAVVVEVEIRRVQA
jgi:hypothetical protein